MKYDIIEAAAACNVTLNVIRHWRRDYASFLSYSARSASRHRTFTPRDVAVLKYIALLHTKQIQSDATLQKLGETPYLEILKLDEEDRQAITPPPLLARLMHSETLAVNNSDILREFMPFYIMGFFIGVSLFLFIWFALVLIVRMS